MEKEEITLDLQNDEFTTQQQLHKAMQAEGKHGV
jgi:hypothetical protein